MSLGSIQVCKPLSLEHRRGLQWFASLTHAAHRVEPMPRPRAMLRSLERAIELYGAYSETGDEKLLGMCERFLRESMGRRG